MISKGLPGLRTTAALLFAMTSGDARDAPHLCRAVAHRARGGKEPVQLRDDLCPFADRAADALDRSRAHVADGEQAGDVRLERRGSGAGDDEAAAVASDPALDEES